MFDIIKQRIKDNVMFIYGYVLMIGIVIIDVTGLIGYTTGHTALAEILALSLFIIITMILILLQIALVTRIQCALELSKGI